MHEKKRSEIASIPQIFYFIKFRPFSRIIGNQAVIFLIIFHLSDTIKIHRLIAKYFSKQVFWWDDDDEFSWKIIFLFTEFHLYRFLLIVNSCFMISLSLSCQCPILWDHKLCYWYKWRLRRHHSSSATFNSLVVWRLRYMNFDWPTARWNRSNIDNGVSYKTILVSYFLSTYPAWIPVCNL